MESIVVAVVVLMIIGLFFGYIFLAIFFPEWVGIAGKTAKEIEEKHNAETHPEVEKIKDL